MLPGFTADALWSTSNFGTLASMVRLESQNLNFLGPQPLGIRDLLLVLVFFVSYCMSSFSSCYYHYYDDYGHCYYSCHESYHQPYCYHYCSCRLHHGVTVLVRGIDAMIVLVFESCHCYSCYA